MASQPNEFFGRAEELETLRDQLQGSHVAIGGAIGIGKSSLLGRFCLMEEGFLSGKHQADTWTTVATQEIQSLDDAARLILKEFVDEDSRTVSHRFSFAHVLGLSKSTTSTTNNFPKGRCLDVLQRVVDEV